MSPYYQDEFVTLYHGDCLTDCLEWLEADVLVTDPPYGMAYTSNYPNRKRPITGDGDTETRDLALWQWNEIPARPWLMFGTWKAPRPTGFKQLLIWDKTDGVGPGMGNLSEAFGTSHEEIYLFGDWLKRSARRGSVIRTSEAMGSPNGLVARYGHPTPKPVSLMQILIAAAPAGVLADPFAGSGSTLVAARNMGRHIIGVEVEEKYCAIAAQRLNQGAFNLEGMS